MPNNVLRSFLWKYLERCSSQAVQLVVSIVLARLLVPEDFGLLVLVMVFIAFANVFVQSGLKAALVQKKDVDSIDFSTVFWSSLSLATVMYALLFFTAPVVANFYENESLIAIVRVLGISLFLGALSSVQEAYIQKHFLFKKMFFRKLAATVLSGFLGILLAYIGFGVWTLVWYQLVNVFLMCIFMYFMIPWKPAIEFSIVSAKNTFNFSYKHLIANLSDTVSVNLTNLLVGKFFTSAMLGFYNRGEQFPKLIISNVNESINAVLFPVLANLQDDIEQFRQKIKKSIKISCFVIFPLMALLASSATPTVKFILGEKWLPCVIFLQVNCVMFAFWPLHTANLVAMNSLGRSDMYLKRGIANNAMSVFALAIALYFFRTPLAVVLSQAFIVPVGCWLNASPSKKLFSYGFLDQIKDILPMLLFSAVAGFAVFPISFLNIPNYAIVFLQVALGLSVYLLLAKIFKIEPLNYLISILRTYLTTPPTHTSYSSKE